jgi:hypothetical protein
MIEATHSESTTCEVLTSTRQCSIYLFRPAEAASSMTPATARGWEIMTTCDAPATTGGDEPQVARGTFRGDDSDAFAAADIREDEPLSYYLAGSCRAAHPYYDDLMTDTVPHRATADSHVKNRDRTPDQ